jgi:hypothetical protein
LQDSVLILNSLKFSQRDKVLKYTIRWRAKHCFLKDGSGTAIYKEIINIFKRESNKGFI